MHITEQKTCFGGWTHEGGARACLMLVYNDAGQFVERHSLPYKKVAILADVAPPDDGTTLPPASEQQQHEYQRAWLSYFFPPDMTIKWR